MIVLDSHCDAPMQMIEGRDYSKDNEGAQVDFPKLKRGGVSASFFALYIPASLKGRDATDHAYKLLTETKRQVYGCSYAAFAYNEAEVRANASTGKISILLGLENASALQEDFSILHDLYEQGVRYVTLTHSEDNQICDSCTGNGMWGGLSPFGRKLVREMNKLDMLIDVAHCSDATIRHCLELSEKPIIYSHGCCRAIASNKRNLSDDLLKEIASNGGVSGMSIYPCFISDNYLSTMPDIDDFIAHISHAADVCGIDHVGIGTDYDGIEITTKGLETVEGFANIPKALLKAGFKMHEIKKILGENMLNLIKTA